MSRTVDQVMLDMLMDLKEVTEGKIDLTPQDFHRDEVISLYPVAGMFASLEAKIENIEDDFHPGSASETGLIKLLRDRQLPDRRQPQKSQGRIKFPGTNDQIVNHGFSARRKLDGKIYVCVQDGIVIDGFVTLAFESSSAGQEYNIDSIGDEFSLVSPVDGLESLGVSVDQFRNGRDLETPGGMLQRLQENDRRVNTSGNPVAYEAWAKEASSLVVTATAIKHPRGESTVDTVITSGTTDIDKAVEDGTPVTRIPSVDLINTVQAFIASRMPTTDDHLTKAAEEEPFDTNIILVLHDESVRSLIESQILKIWKAFVYKVKPGQRIYPTDLEKLIDSKLGFLISFRRVQDFSVSHYYQTPSSKMLDPRTLTITGL